MFDEAFGLVKLLFQEYGKASLMERIGFLGTMVTLFLPGFFLLVKIPV